MNTVKTLPLYLDQRIASVRALLILIGFMPVTCIALNVFELFPLHRTAFFLVFPAMLLTVYMGYKYSETGKIAWQGWLSGLIAVALYDCGRVPFILAGWDDFIPKIGDWILNTEGTHPVVGYTWRYLLNGGGMGMAFMFLVKSGKTKKENMLKGILYGLFIFSCLMLVLVISPKGEEVMFRITPLTFIGSMVGHIIYGAVLGWLRGGLKKEMEISYPYAG